MLLFTLLCFIMFTCPVVYCQAVDMTLVDGANGAEVVQAVVDLIKSNCIYADDRLFLRRLAYVESHDGLDPKTFRIGYYGGIWQVDKDKYDATTNCQSSYALSGLCDIIKDKFKISWDKTNWKNLTKPLYSGLAASLYLYLRAGNSTPGQIDQQATFWAHYYHFGENPTDYLSTIKGMDDESCEQKNPIDIVFVADSSASIGIINYITMMNFLQNVTDNLDIGPDSVHVGMVTFESYAQVEFYLNRYHDRTAVKNAIGRVYYLDGGTDIAAGISAARRQVFSESYGARKNAVKVMILLTDGFSNYNSTLYEAERAHNDGIVIFAIGIGDSLSDDELKAAATDPDCTHVFLLSNFNEMDSLLYQIKKSACRSSVSIQLPEPIFRPKNSSETVNSTKVEHIITNKLEGNKTKQTTVTFNQPKTDLSTGSNSSTKVKTTGIVTNVTCGIVRIYASYITPHPGPAIHEIHSIATDNHPSVLYVNSSRNGKPLYITYVGTKLPESAAGVKNCSDASYTVTFTDGPPKGPSIFCRDEAGERECTKTDFLLNTKFQQWICPTDQIQTSIQNPCTAYAIKNNDLFHPYPNDNTKFIRCDYKGNMYVTLCPNGEKYYQGRQSCGSQGQVPYSNKDPLHSSVRNPCTQSAILNDNMFFSYSKDPTKFIHCNVWGHAYVISCPSGQIWTQGAETCTPDSLNVAGTQGTGHSTHIQNPCTKENIEKNNMFFPLPDKSKYIHCDIGGNSWVQSCGQNLIFDVASSSCVYDPRFGG